MQLTERTQPAVRLADSRPSPNLAAKTQPRSAPAGTRLARSAADAQSRYAAIPTHPGQMNHIHLSRLLALSLAAAACGACSGPGERHANDPVCHGPSGLPPGSVSPDSAFELVVGVAEAEQGALAIIERAGGRVTWRRVVDLGSYVWSPDGRWLVYAASPIYDIPRIFAVDPRSGGRQLLVAPQTRDSFYPDGADWMEVRGVVSDTSVGYRVVYTRLPYVDSIDFDHYPRDLPRQSAHLPPAP